MQPTTTIKPAIERLHCLAVALKTATDEANHELQQPLTPGAGSEDDRAFALLDSYVVAVLDAMIAAGDSEWLTPARLISYIERLAETQDQRAGDLLALCPWLVGDPAISLSAIPIVGYIAPDPARGNIDTCDLEDRD